ncbi:hypothetical protein [Estrella lausannensis]|uniref:Uncharacterized protein n=1 Tax=Estrella lausannensis TaxID=483423 RepID=A0A0H5DND1_9BACT|nr:hypothetical protein [Estrella lausannensis]CRX37677.1 Hypothetical protein ELAC_0316 [Estrella lausannensis]
MYTFQEVSGLKDLDAYSGWTEIKRCEEDTTVLLNDKGDVVTAFYQGRVFRFLSQRIQEYSLAEIVLRVALGILAAVATLGLSLISRAVRELFITTPREIRFGEFLQDAEPGALVEGHPGGLIDFYPDSTGCHYPERDGEVSAMCEHICHFKDTNEVGSQGDLVVTGAEVRDCLQWLPKHLVDKFDTEHFSNIVIPL